MIAASMRVASGRGGQERVIGADMRIIQWLDGMRVASSTTSPSTFANDSPASATNASGDRTCSPRSFADIQREIRPWRGSKQVSTLITRPSGASARPARSEQVAGLLVGEVVEQAEQHHRVDRRQLVQVRRR